MPINKLAQPLEWCLHQHLATDQARTDSTPGQTRPSQTRLGQTSWPLCGYINSANGTPGSQPASLRSFPSIHFLFSPPSLPPPPLQSPLPSPTLGNFVSMQMFCALLLLFSLADVEKSAINSVSQSVGPARAGSQFSMAASLAVWQSVKPEDQPR